MVAFLSPEFFAAASEALVGHDGFATASHGVSMAVQFRVGDTPHGDVAYGLKIHNGSATLTEGELPARNLTITNDYATAVGISQGSINTQEAFIKGRMRIDGEMASLMKNRPVIEQFAVAMAALEIEY